MRGLLSFRFEATTDLKMSAGKRTTETVSLQFCGCIRRGILAVVYARYSYLDGSVSTRIVAAKTGVNIQRSGKHT